ncbi:MAG: hypothetical protein Kow0069_11530 [Promethearchaeota archaeon]
MGGRRVYPSLLHPDVPEIDLCIIAVPARLVPDAVRQCHAKGVKFAVISSSGFAEAGDDELDEELKKAIAEGPTRVVGPNCLGVLNSESRVTYFPNLEFFPGPASIVAQSGGTTARLMTYLLSIGIGVRNVVSIDNAEPELEGRVDVWCPHAGAFPPDGPAGGPGSVEAQHALGRQYFYYTCCSWVDRPTVSFVDPAWDHVAIFLCGWGQGFDGFLFWDVNAYVGQDVGDPHRLGYDGLGDALFLLHDADDRPISTITWDSMRDGLELVEFLEALEAVNPDSSLLGGAKVKWGDQRAYPPDPATYSNLRERLGEELDTQAATSET